MHVWDLEQRMFHVPAPTSKAVQPLQKARAIHDESGLNAGPRLRNGEKRSDKSFASFLEEARKRV